MTENKFEGQNLLKESLLREYDNPDEALFIAIDTATNFEDIRPVERLLNAGVDVNVKGRCGCTPLIEASGRNNIEIVKLLLDKGADVNAKMDDGTTALMMASIWNRTKIAELLIDKGADVNARDNKGITPLMDASSSGHVKIVELLINKKADVNAESEEGYTALSKAMYFRYKHYNLRDSSPINFQETIELLKTAGAKE